MICGKARVSIFTELDNWIPIKWMAFLELRNVQSHQVVVEHIRGKLLSMELAGTTAVRFPTSMIIINT